jgi:hypothetical protein
VHAVAPAAGADMIEQPLVIGTPMGVSKAIKKEKIAWIIYVYAKVENAVS